ncbi:aBC transporter ATP-binding and permease protein [Firmicutes bacterium CAG:582]|nr:aBC transporter ATP-binding and permease protein [Firmicutes bacterium CAG:582]
MKVIEVKNLSKAYGTNIVLKNKSFVFETKKLYAIVGHSGSGKTTLFNIIGLIDNDYDGELTIDGAIAKKMSIDYKARLRNKKIGFVFQNFLLNDYLTVIENVCLPLITNKKLSKYEKQNKALKILNQLNIESKSKRFPKELSGGEQQRVAIARALINDPDIILADEPTGNLDRDNENEVFKELKKLANAGKCVIVISHSQEILKYADKKYDIEEA